MFNLFKNSYESKREYKNTEYRNTVCLCTFGRLQIGTKNANVPKEWHVDTTGRQEFEITRDKSLLEGKVFRSG